MTARASVGVVGLGAMGLPMAVNLRRAGHAVTGFDVSAEAVASAAREGIATAVHPAAVSAASDVVLTMVWDDDALARVIFDAQTGLLASTALPRCTIDLSTTSVAVARRAGEAFASRGRAFMDGAVIGGGVAAIREGRSPLVVAGSAAAYADAMPVLAVIGRAEFVGPLGTAKAVKLINNLLVGVLTASNAEALSLGTSLGLAMSDMLAWLRDSDAGSNVLASYVGSRVERGRYPDGLIGHALMAKDLRLAAQLAEATGTAMSFPRFAEQAYLEFGRHRGATEPFPCAYEYFREASTRGAQLR
ncbi:MAG: NAD(P)-dependent oxidoreductase [Proteobacteria bacterium]|nr:NAD(P)-dependent oxidoreductase [Pseudomonadota bacterium]